MSITEKVKASTDADVERLSARVVKLEGQVALLRTALEGMREHAEWSTPQGNKAFNAAFDALLQTATLPPPPPKPARP
jgi:hypothetical protein